MSKQLTGFVAWMRSFLDDVYANITHTHTKSQITDLAENVFYGTCSTTSTTQTKVVTVSNWSFTTGNILFVKFDDYNKYNGTAKISIDGTTKDIATVGTTKTSRYYWKAGEVVGFVYDGTNMVLLEGGTATTTYYGITKLSSSVSSTSEVLSATPNAVKQAYDLANAKQDALVSGTNIKTINNESLLGSGNISISGGGGTIDDTVTQNSSNPVKSSGIYSALQTKQGQLSLLSAEIDEYGNSIFNDDGSYFYSTNDRIYHDYGNTDELHFIDSTGNDVNFDDIITTDDLTWNNITGKPSTFTPSSHNHNTWTTINLTNGTLYVNTDLRMCELHYSKSHNLTSANTWTFIETISQIANYPPKTTLYVHGSAREVMARLFDTGSLQANFSAVGQRSITFNLIWHY